MIPVCDQCQQWQPSRIVETFLGPQQRPGYCQARAAASLEQLPPTHAQVCRLFSLEIPF